MKRRIKTGRIWIAAISFGILVLLGWTVWHNVRAFERIDYSIQSTAMLEGEYSIDGGEWRPIDNSKPINERFEKAVFKGHFSKEVRANHSITMDIVSKNVRYTIYDAEGEIIDGYIRDACLFHSDLSF